jgi:hypothetical protein
LICAPLYKSHAGEFAAPIDGHADLAIMPMELPDRLRGKGIRVSWSA